MNLIIVESPTKGKTIQKFLGKEYKLLSSFGHVRDLPKSELGVDVEHDFTPRYVIPPKARKTISILKKELKNASKTILATDEDREGEAIAWHLGEVLELKNPERIVFHEITKPAIEQALKSPRRIDMNLVDSQQARRILDRIVGYKLSPFLWKKIAKGLSAGRVQSVTVRLVVEREREIEKFISEEYWTIVALFKKQKSEFEALLVKKDGEIIPKLGIKNKERTDEIVKDLEGAEYKIVGIEKKETKKNPLPPFATSTLQQEAWKKFHYPAKMTMSIAQNLYEKGYITYHRTDSFNLSQIALFSAKKFIEENYGKNYWAGYLRKYKSGKGSQEAHEAIRPTFIENTPEKLKTAELDQRNIKLYELIWQRFVACQMAPASFYSTNVEIETGISNFQFPISKQISNSKCQIPNYTFRATGQILKFDGFLKIYPMKFNENQLPELEKDEILKLLKLIPDQHFTEPPARYNEATLIKELEKNGIGRPSTYAPILSTIQERNYVEKNEEKRFKPTEIGIIVNDLLVKNFPEIVDIDFTAKMEKELDEIAEGKDTLVKTCNDFYSPFAKNLEKKYEEIPRKKAVEKPTDKKCPTCGAPIVERLGRFGRFYACSKFPECKYTESLEKNNLNIKCPKCDKGEIIEKRTRLRSSGFGGQAKTRKIFYACNKWPECDFALWDKPINEKCPQCGSLLTEKAKIIRCSNKKCDYKK